jgi:3-oxoadipate enol-lactonase
MVEFAALDGIRLAYRTWGDPAARPMVWLHGGSSDGDSWAGIAPGLPVHSYAIDLRGYGASDRSERYGPEVSRDDVVAFLDALGLDRVTLAGHSAGAVVAYLTAITHPDRVAALVLEEPVPPVPHDMHPVRPDGELPYDFAARLATLAWVNEPDPVWWDRLATITAPTLLIAGGEQSHLDQDDLARMAARIPGAELVTIAAGHGVHGVRPAEFTAAVAGFLTGTV